VVDVLAVMVTFGYAVALAACRDREVWARKITAGMAARPRESL
jgi:hypothetical protein